MPLQSWPGHGRCYLRARQHAVARRLVYPSHLTAETVVFLNFYFIAIVIVREVNNTFKNLLRAKGCQSIYKHGGGGQDRSEALGLGFTPGPGPDLDRRQPPALCCELREHHTATGLCSQDLVGDLSLTEGPTSYPGSSPTPHKPAQRGPWEAPKDRGSVRDTQAGTGVSR